MEEKYSQTPLIAYHPWTIFVSLKRGNPENGFIIPYKNVTGVTCVIRVATSFGATPNRRISLTETICEGQIFDGIL